MFELFVAVFLVGRDVEIKTVRGFETQTQCSLAAKEVVDGVQGIHSSKGFVVRSIVLTACYETAIVEK